MLLPLPTPGGPTLPNSCLPPRAGTKVHGLTLLTVCTGASTRLVSWFNEAIHKIGRHIRDQHKVAHMMQVLNLLIFEA